jgi:casein kinase II subunit beta
MDMVFNSSDEDEYGSDVQTFIEWLVSLRGCEFFVAVDEEFIRDSFNLYGLRQLISRYDEALEMLLSDEPPEEDMLDDENFIDSYRSALDLYGMIHARFVLTTRGQQLVREKFARQEFGRCPRVLCNAQACLPCGIFEELRRGFVRSFCPTCKQIYVPKGRVAELDGAYFGPSLPSMFLLTYPGIASSQESTTAKAATSWVPQYFTPKVFGFRVHGRKSVVQLKLEADTTLRLCMPPSLISQGLSDS